MSSTDAWLPEDELQEERDTAAPLHDERKIVYWSVPDSGILVSREINRIIHPKARIILQLNINGSICNGYHAIFKNFRRNCCNQRGERFFYRALFDTLAEDCGIELLATIRDQHRACPLSEYAAKARIRSIATYIAKQEAFDFVNLKLPLADLYLALCVVLSK